jgi:hypothetical protein
MADEACEGGGSDQEEIAIDGSPLLTPPVVVSRVELSPTKPVTSSSVVAASGRPAGQKRMLLPYPTEKIDKNKLPTQRPRDQPPATPVRTWIGGMIAPRNTHSLTARPSASTKKVPISSILPSTAAAITSPESKSEED